MPDRLKLRIELVPKRLWEQNLRLRDGLGKHRWDKLRHEVIKKNGARCAVCGAIDRKLHGHEVWDYREKKTVGTAVLLRVEIICIDCHDIRHWGRTTNLFQAGVISAERYGHLRKHFRRVNRCTQKSFDGHFLRQARIWLQRSKKRWKVDWGDFTPLVAEATAARIAWAARNHDHENHFNVKLAYHMPDRCPKCGIVGRLTSVEADRDEMSEGQEADYDAGLWGFALCHACNSNVHWQG
ncbi:MAG TPA: hypothetical protein VIJ67_15250 [Pseudolabrys sp.]